MYEDAEDQFAMPRGIDEMREAKDAVNKLKPPWNPTQGVSIHLCKVATNPHFP